MITTNSRIKGKKPSELILPTMEPKDRLLETTYNQYLELVMPVEKKDIMQINDQKQTTGPQESTLRDKLASVHFRISTLETTPEDIQVATSYMKDLLKHTS
ncbi:hypothetical protein Tco_1428720 [Tanacetum coccineum]